METSFVYTSRGHNRTLYHFKQKEFGFVNEIVSREELAGQIRLKRRVYFQGYMNNTLEWTMERGKRSLCSGRVTVMVTIKVSLSWVRAV